MGYIDRTQLARLAQALAPPTMVATSPNSRVRSRPSIFPTNIRVATCFGG